MADSAPCYRAAVMTQELHNYVNHMDWPEHSLALNPVEQAWDMLVRLVRALSLQLPPCLGEPGTSVLAEWRAGWAASQTPLFSCQLSVFKLVTEATRRTPLILKQFYVLIPICFKLLLF